MSQLSPDQWQALSPLLDLALEMTDDERTTWLIAFRQQNPAVASQLESLLHEHGELSKKGFLEISSLPLPDNPGLTGQIFGAYTLLSQIGHGGMGSVWLAERSDGRFERRVAVKILNIALMGKAGEDRFKREGRILGSLKHPHVAELLDAGVSPAGQPFLVLEYVEGDHIDRYCDQRNLDIRARIQLFLDALHGVAAAHLNLIVHRDLKPSNILVGKDGQAKLLDFGIAKLLEGDGNAQDSPLTLEGGRAMTPEYAAPEQLKGEVVTASTDVYSSGALLYVLLTGHHPAGAGRRTPANLLNAILQTEPAPPSLIVVSSSPENTETSVASAKKRATTPEKLARSLRGDLDTILAKALKKNPQERYLSINEFADDLERYLGHQAITARPDAFTYRVSKFLRRRFRLVAAVSLIILALVGATTITWFYSRASRPLPNLTQRKLTANAQDSPVLNAAISPDGKYLSYADQQGLHLQLVATGSSQTVPLPPGVSLTDALWTVGGWYPDSTRFVASVNSAGMPSVLWSIPILGGEAHRLAEVEEMFGGGSVSPDGSQVAYQRLRSVAGAREIWLMGSNGGSPHKILTAENRAAIVGIAWSPTGNRIAYGYARWQGDHLALSVQSCDLNGANKTMILQDNRLSAFAWVASGRFIYSRNTEVGSAESDNLWELRVDRKKGTPQGKARQLTDWSGFSVRSFSATADGAHLAFLRGTSRATVIVGDLTSGESRLINSRRLTLDDNYNIPLTWTPDSREVIFSSQRAGIRLMYRQALDQGSSPQPITPPGDTNFYIARFSPDGAWILLEGEPSGTAKMAMYRVSSQGGVPQQVFDPQGFVQFWCTNKAANLCVFGRPSSDKNELVISAFDALSGPGKELVRIPLEAGSSADIGFDYSWQLSPDGSRIGIVKRYGNKIRLVPLDGGQTTTIDRYSDLLELNWAFDSQSMFVSIQRPGTVVLMHVGLNGDSRSIWQQPQSSLAWGIPSPDGRHLAIVSTGAESNAWLIGNF